VITEVGYAAQRLLGVRSMFARSLAVLVLGAVASFALPASADAAGSCDAMLIDLQDSQSALAALEQAIDKGEADRAALRGRARAIASAIAEAHAAGRDASDLQAEHDAIVSDLSDLEANASIVATQLDALRTEVESAERAYITCVDASLS
jgi:hypothetical protein